MASTMNFFQAQDDARGRTTKLVLLLALAAIVVAIVPFVLVMAVYAYNVPHVSWYQPELFAYATVPTLIIMLKGGLSRISKLAKGGCGIAGQMGARLISSHPTDPAERVYLNVVQEMALASGLPVPSCYVFAGDKTINAFAAANEPKDAAIAVTNGALASLTRDELQGVVAYVMGHISNGDTKLSFRFIGTVGGLTAVTELFQTISTEETEDTENRMLVLSIFITTLGSFFLAAGASVGFLLIKAIQAAVWQQRESLSDASAVQFTRNPAALASALEKLAVRGSAVKSAANLGPEWQNFFFAPMQGGVANSFSLKSSIADRIKFIDPSFVITFPDIIPPMPSIIVEAVPPFLTAGGGTLATDKQFLTAFGFGGVLPSELRAAAAEPVGAMGIVLGLILRQDAALRAQQLAQAQGLAGGEVVKEALKLAASLRALPAGHRVPLLDLAMPALRQLSPSQVVEFGEAINQVGCQADDGLVVLLIHASMRRYLSVVPGRVGKSGDLYASCALVLSAVVQTSSEGPAAQAAAYLKGANALGMKHVSLVMIPAELVNLADVENMLSLLADESVNDRLRRKLLNACCVAMLSDGKTEPAEVEIVRAVGDSLGISFATGIK